MFLDQGNNGVIHTPWEDPNTGFKSVKKSLPVNTFEVKMEFPFDVMKDEDKIKIVNQQMAEGISKEIIRQNALRITKEPNLYQNTIIYHGKVKIVSDYVDMTNVSENKTMFLLEGHEFNEEQIKYALRNSFPEYFI